VEVVVASGVGGAVYMWAFLGCAVVNVVGVFWVADLFWRGVDGRCVGWGRWVEGLVTERRGR
jgi:hypothetical protein